MSRRGIRFQLGMFSCIGVVCVLLVGCGQGIAPEEDSARLVETFQEVLVPPRYSEHLSCTLRDKSNQWQHMYRLSLDDLVGEFVGGQGGRITTLQSTAMQVSPSCVAIAFEAESQPQQGDLEIRPFRVHIHRQTLVYQWFWVPADNASGAETPHLFGKCVLLDAGSF